MEKIKKTILSREAKANIIQKELSSYEKEVAKAKDLLRRVVEKKEGVRKHLLKKFSRKKHGDDEVDADDGWGYSNSEHDR